MPDAKRYTGPYHLDRHRNRLEVCTLDIAIAAGRKRCHANLVIFAQRLYGLDRPELYVVPAPADLWTGRIGSKVHTPLMLSKKGLRKLIQASRPNSPWLPALKAALDGFAAEHERLRAMGSTVDETGAEPVSEPDEETAEAQAMDEPDEPVDEPVNAASYGSLVQTFSFEGKNVRTVIIDGVCTGLVGMFASGLDMIIRALPFQRIARVSLNTTSFQAREAPSATA